MKLGDAYKDKPLWTNHSKLSYNIKLVKVYKGSCPCQLSVLLAL